MLTQQIWFATLMQMIFNFQATQTQQLKSEATSLWRENKLCFVMNKFCMFENVV